MANPVDPLRPLPPFERGMHDIGGGCYAWLEPLGGWGFANSGLVLGSTESLVVDTQNDVPMATALRREVDRLLDGRRVSTVVNTHSDGDHWNGNMLYEGARIIASDACIAEMTNMWLDVTRLAEMASPDTPFGRFIGWRVAQFRYGGWRPLLPTDGYSDRLTVEAGDTTVELVEVGPAHTNGDTIVHVPHAGVVYAGDVLFTDSTPIVWSGPLSRCVAACDRILDCQPRIVVPGHGPVVDASGVTTVRDYLRFVEEYAKSAYAAGKGPQEAYAGIDLAGYAGWRHLSRTYQNILVVYRELDPANYTVAPQQALNAVLADDDGVWTTAAAYPASQARA